MSRSPPRSSLRPTRSTRPRTSCYGEARGDELPPELADPTTRKARLREAKRRAGGRVAGRARARVRRCSSAAPSTSAGPGDGRRGARRRRPSCPTAGRRRQPDRSGLAVGQDAARVHPGLQRPGRRRPKSRSSSPPRSRRRQRQRAARADDPRRRQPSSRPPASSDPTTCSPTPATGEPAHRSADGERHQGARPARRPRAQGAAAGATRAAALRPHARTAGQRRRQRALPAPRKTMIEPIFGQTKHNRRADRFQRRGLAACRAEWRLITATHNLLKLHRATAPDPPRERLA